MLWLSLLPALVQANGRMPGANDVVLDPHVPEHLLLRATFGVVQSFDGANSWQWICEQALGTSGAIADPPIALLADGSIVVLPPQGGARISNDRGCSWIDAPEPLAGQRGVDLTLDPGDAAHLFVLMSTLSGVDDAGLGTYRNLLIETRDSGETWRHLDGLPSDFQAETVEVAPSNPARIYVSGISSKNRQLGILQRSSDGGTSWTQSSLQLPAGTGSLLISAVHPALPNRLWVRVPSSGDTFGVLPARIYVSDDEGQSYRMLAATQRGMFGFALSPDGTELAYGGPSDGLYVGLSDGSAEFSKVSALGVRCLRWTASGALYACGTDPPDPFSLGVSHDRGATFEPLYALIMTCPAVCGEGASSFGVCQEAWQSTRPFIGASGMMCAGRSAESELDAGGIDAASPAPQDISGDKDAATTTSAGTGAPAVEGDANVPEHGMAAARRASGCSCRVEPRRAATRGPEEAMALAAVLGVFLRRWHARDGA